MDLTSFSHGQIVSKEWLCEQLEAFLFEGGRIAILGSWYNILGFMLVLKTTKKLDSLHGYDIDPDCKPIADSICNAYLSDFGGPIQNYTLDAKSVDFTKYDIVINCSCEHMSPDWYDSLPKSTVVCLQTSDMTPDKNRWQVEYPFESLESFQKTFPLKTLLYRGTKEIAYSEFSYRRFMLIGLK